MAKDTEANYSIAGARRGYNASPKGEETAEAEELDFSEVGDRGANLGFDQRRRGPPTLFDKSFYRE